MRGRILLVAGLASLVAAGGAILLSSLGGATSPRHDPPPAPPAARLRVVSFNVWGLPLGAAADLETRLARMPAALRALDADVICLQECWTVPVRDALIAGLAPEWSPAHAAGGGLVLLSRLPLSDARFTPYPPAPHLSLLEKLAGKGILEATVATASGPVRVLDTHCTAFDHPSRDVQIRHFLSATLGGEPDLPLLLVGDMNLHPVLAGPDGAESFDPVYAAVLSAGFEDARPPVREQDGRFELPAPGTWGGWPRPESDDEARQAGASIDHVFARGGGGRGFHVLATRVELWSRRTALSDHNLLLADLEIAPR